MICFILSKSKGFEIRPYALANALAKEGQRLGRTKLDRMIAEAVKIGYMVRGEEQGRQKSGQFGRYAYICGLPEDVAAELKRQAATTAPSSPPQSQSPDTVEPLSALPNADSSATFSTKRMSSPIIDQTNHQHHQSGQQLKEVPVGRLQATDEGYSQAGRHALASGMTFVWIESRPYRQWREYLGENGMPWIDVAVIDGRERRGSWMPSMYPPGRGFKR